jgi:hypothetical protein
MKTEKIEGKKRVRWGVVEAIGLVPLLAPLPTAWVVGSAMATIMHWPWPVALVGALIIEGLGFGTVDTAMRMREWNKNRRKRFDVNRQRTVYLDPAAPTFYAIIILAVYLAVALALTVLLDMLPELATYAPGVFPFLGVLGAGLWALRADHDRRVREKESDKQEQREERKEARAAKLAANLREPSRKGAGLRGTSSRKGVQLAELLAFWESQPKATDGEVARHFGVERQAIWQRRQRLMRDGAIHWNGNGVVVIHANEEPMKEAADGSE